MVAVSTLSHLAELMHDDCYLLSSTLIVQKYLHGAYFPQGIQAR